MCLLLLLSLCAYAEAQAQRGEVPGIVVATGEERLRLRIVELEAELAAREARIAVLEAELSALKSAQGVVEDRQAQLDRREAAIEVMAGAVATGELAAQYDAAVTVVWDEARGRTVVSAGPVALVDEALVGDFFVSAVYSVPGEVPGETPGETSGEVAGARPESVSVFVQGKFSGGQFEGLESLAFELAEGELVLPVSGYERAKKRSGMSGKNRAKTGDEVVTLVLDVATVRRLAEATSLTMRTPKGPVRWGREHRALLRALLARMEGMADLPQRKVGSAK